ncbi:hypothetical protein FBY21_1560 [Pseudomonas sp. SLBN-26]|uniref:hypothetical protein n=1 Tax=Pseudomonadaceae TaxID=135621 RepID=UPI0011512FB5|nr:MULTISPECIES: hypothetical protein [Pseudomonas]MCP1616961.1 hypothetical protein [Pseudomonas otitidis]TQL06206.1 hypothetical protein FBY21_1560 [Pseudomonas sp. SLBN-26]
MTAHLVVRSRPGGVLVARGSSLVVTAARAAPQVLALDAGRRFLVLAGLQGPKGSDGLDGVQVSQEPDNRLELKPDGLYVADGFVPDPLAYYILAKG